MIYGSILQKERTTFNVFTPYKKAAKIHQGKSERTPQTDRNDFYIWFYIVIPPTIAKNIFFLNSHELFTNTEHTKGHKTYLKKFKRKQIYIENDIRP